MCHHNLVSFTVRYVAVKLILCSRKLEVDYDECT
jgi:hypothetical protein